MPGLQRHRRPLGVHLKVKTSQCALQNPVPGLCWGLLVPPAAGPGHAESALLRSLLRSRKAFPGILLNPEGEEHQALQWGELAAGLHF